MTSRGIFFLKTMALLLGRIIDGSITDRKSVDELAEKLSGGLKIIDKSPFKGTQKLWILQHLLIP